MKQYPLAGRPMSGAKSSLTELSRHYPLGVVSNGFADMQRRKLAALGFSDLFKSMVFSSEAGVLKPQPEIFQRAATELQCAPADCLFVGDSYERDMLGARAAGMQTCWFNPGGTRLLPQQPKPDFEIGALSAIARLVLRR
jgi:HAD superfamily hydrolase (TIGR01509 family)